MGSPKVVVETARGFLKEPEDVDMYSSIQHGYYDVSRDDATVFANPDEAREIIKKFNIAHKVIGLQPIERA